MQRGTVIRHRQSWTLLYYDLQFRDGKQKRVRVSKKLAKVSKEFPSSASVRHLADEILAPLNRRQLQPESSLKVSEYIQDFYFPSVERDLRPSTIASYRFIFNRKLDGKLNIKMRDFRTVHGQRLLREIPVGRRSLIHIKAFLSAVFKHAKQQGVLDGVNPITDASVPGRPTKFKGAAYSINEVMRMLDDLEPPEGSSDKTASRYQTASDVIGVLSLTGLRQSECRGLLWSDWDEEARTLNISRSVWKNNVGPTKNLASENSIPVIPLLRNILDARRGRLQAKPGDYIFAGARSGTPLNFHNLEDRIIKPALKKTRLWRMGGDNKWSPDESTGITWEGFHGFRRGLASNLFSMGVNPKLIAAILRHGDVSTTLQWYIQTPDSETREAMEKLEAKFNVPGLIMNQSSGPEK